MATPSIARLGHVGLHVHDLEKQKEFFRDTVGLTVTDEDPGLGLVFMSARPEEEHHELLLCRGRNVDSGAHVVQQLSFRCDSVDDAIGFYRRLKARGVTLERTISHGNAIGVYFFDPEGNRCEIYCATGLQARQPYGKTVDLERPADELLREVEEHVRQYGKTGYREPGLATAQNVSATPQK